MNIGITATRSVRPHEPIMQAVLASLPKTTRVIVGGCRGGDCLAARYALQASLAVHTVLPGNQAQLCDHWKDFMAGRRADEPHTTTWETVASDSYRVRNERIVELGKDGLLAFPDKTEQQPHSGTTMTINIGKRRARTVKVRALHAR